MAESWTVFILGWYATFPFGDIISASRAILETDIESSHFQVPFLQLDPALCPLLARPPANTGCEDDISNLC